MEGRKEDRKNFGARQKTNRVILYRKFSEENNSSRTEIGQGGPDEKETKKIRERFGVLKFLTLTQKP